MTHARGAVSHTIKLPRSQRAEGHDCLELKGREKRRQYVGATAQLLARRSAIAESPLPFVKTLGQRKTISAAANEPFDPRISSSVTECSAGCSVSPTRISSSDCAPAGQTKKFSSSVMRKAHG
jgi:hypothetical protein